MALNPGTRLGPYEIAGLIGAGGMGEVYRASDTRLKRAVAIKVLPESLASDADRLARFQREAEVLASLSHPTSRPSTVGTNGDSDRLVMEFVEGPTLAERLAEIDSGLPLDDVLAIARQITDALEAAHDQGIVHRDLKPANIKIRPDGTVKVLDFGLAKVIEPGSLIRGSGSDGAGALLSQSPTITTPAMTQAGLILGTAAYMSPEQARGKPIDRRADIWAFGCVLYEMLTGRRAFDADDVSITLARVLERDVDLETLPTGVPARLRQVIALCLRKDSRQRVQSIGDVRLALDGAFETATPQPSISSYTSAALASCGAVCCAHGRLRGDGRLPGVATGSRAGSHALPDPRAVGQHVAARNACSFARRPHAGVHRHRCRRHQAHTCPPDQSRRDARAPRHRGRGAPVLVP